MLDMIAMSQALQAGRISSPPRFSEEDFYRMAPQTNPFSWPARFAASLSNLARFRTALPPPPHGLSAAPPLPSACIGDETRRRSASSSG